MPEKISIKERIERQLLLQLLEIDDGVPDRAVKSAHRTDLRGKRTDQEDFGRADLKPDESDDLGHLDAFLVVLDEVTQTEPNGNIGYTEKRMPCIVGVMLKVAENDGENTAFVHNRWLRLIENTIGANRQILEAETDVRLAIDTRVTATSQPPTVAGQPDFAAMVQFDVTYQHNADDTCVGPGITAKEI